MPRYLADPPSRSGRLLTKRELDAALRVLTALRRPQASSILMSWDDDMQDMLGGLERAGYVETRPGYGPGGPRKASASFRPDVLATTDLGNEYLDSITKTRAVGHARRRASSPGTGGEKTPRQLDLEIAQSLAARGKPQLADLFADPEARRAFAQEMRHELQKRQTSEKTLAGNAARPFVVKHLEGGRRAMFGRYPSESEASGAADRVDGWVEHEGQVIYGQAPGDHASLRGR